MSALLFLSFRTAPNFLSSQTAAFPLEISKTLKAKAGDASLNWCRDNRFLSALIGGVLKIIHPELHEIATTALTSLRLSQPTVRPWILDGEDRRMEDVLDAWFHPFSAVSLMVNRATPCHRDVGGRNSWTDILLTMGEYEDGRLELPGLGVRLRYEPRTVVGLLGKVVRHGASEVRGERMCLAYYMRDKVHERLGFPAGGWMNVNMYR